MTDAITITLTPADLMGGAILAGGALALAALLVHMRAFDRGYDLAREGASRWEALYFRMKDRFRESEDIRGRLLAALGEARDAIGPVVGLLDDDDTARGAEAAPRQGDAE